jgi:hypothetical protein
MSEKYRATDKDWELVEGWAPDDTDVRCLLELRSRVKALEKAIRVITGSLTPAEQAELGVVSVKDLQADLRSIAFEATKAAQEANPTVKDSLTVAPARSLVERLPEPSDELLEFWRQRAMAEYRDSCYEVPVSRSMALQAIAWCRQQLQPGAVEASQ